MDLSVTGATLGQAGDLPPSGFVGLESSQFNTEISKRSGLLYWVTKSR